MKKYKVQSRKIVIAVISSIILLLILSILLSTYWSNLLDQTLLSTILNIIASLIGVFVGIIAAIFIIEKYLDNSRKEALELQQFREQIHKTFCSAEITARLSCHFECIIFLSYFILFGRKRWITTSSTNIPELEIPESTPKFMIWINNVYMEKKLAVSDLERFKEAFNEPTELTNIKNSDIQFLFHFVDMSLNHIRDFLFLLQPFIEDNFELARNLVSYARDLNEFLDTRYSYFKPNSTGDTTIVLDHRLKRLITSVGTSSANIYSLTYSYILK
jgi:TRAP-type C4-dicarboxylate transport system permease small subunit